MTSTDTAYYANIRGRSIANRVSLFARHRVTDLFMRSMRPTAATTILDIGATDEGGEDANALEAAYPWPEQITCATLGDGSALVAQGHQHVSIQPGAPLPFSDKAFDIAYSNAVLEHVGGPVQRLAFLKEAARVSRALFIVIPNRWFPVEHHTSLPLLHWWPRAFRHFAAHHGMEFISTERNLAFLSKSNLRAEWPFDTEPPTVRYSGIPLGPFSSNIVLISDLRH